MNKKIGKQTYKIENDIAIIGEAAIASDKEAEGPIGKCLDEVMPDIKFGQKSFEKGESRLLEQTMLKALEKSGKVNSQIDCVLTGDLLNQCISSNYALRNVRIPFYGLYGACSTMAESLSLSSMLLDGGFGKTILCGAGSHFYSAERQYRYPIEYGGQRPPTAQWTVTGSGMAVLETGGIGPCVTYVTTGKVADKGVCDANNMGSAMAPAAAETLLAHFKDTNTQPKDYDLIVTGDLGSLGKSITMDLVKDSGFELAGVYEDCGVLIYDAK
ncbi:MAG: stage V sporulation protein AD, partial [Eubacteriales bacterium]|nr:stage V sporulation protein AD [Eubacteriales bacterium]